tara:strand:+ start:3683 stop:4156 length:474 start_codon:yes stop_codon:yes gene_type:complete
MGSRSASGLSMSAICGYCGASHQVKIPYPQFLNHLPPDEALKSLQHHMINRNESQHSYRMRKFQREQGINFPEYFSFGTQEEDDSFHFSDRQLEIIAFFNTLEDNLQPQLKKADWQAYIEKIHLHRERLDEKWFDWLYKEHGMTFADVRQWEKERGL